MMPLSPRASIFITHAAPDDNEFALWLSSKLAMAGYRIWIDRQRLRGGADFWDEIEQVLRNETLKQVVVFTENVRKEGVKKELALGDQMRKKLSDSKFMIPIRNSGIDYGDAPTEFLRDHIINAHPNWHDCLKELFEALEDGGVPRQPSPDTQTLQRLVEAREDGRRFTVERPETLLTNWFPIRSPENVFYYRFEGVQEQTRAWLKDCRVPVIELGRLAGSFADPAAFALASTFELQTPTAYNLPFGDFISGKNLGPYVERSSATNDVVSLLRQHFNILAAKRGLISVEFATKDIGWFFPDGLLPGNKINFQTAEGRRIRRAMSGKFKELRWHVCLVAKPRVWPELVYRLHINVVLSTDGKTPIPGEKTHKRRRRLTKSWWNDIWRDRLLAAVHYLCEGSSEVVFETGHTNFYLSPTPVTVSTPVSFEATDPPLASEEDDEGTIVPIAALDDQLDEFDQASDEDMPEGEAEL